MRQCDWTAAERALLALLERTSSYKLADDSIHLYLQGYTTSATTAATSSTDITSTAAAAGVSRDVYPYYKLLAQKFPK